MKIPDELKSLPAPLMRALLDDKYDKGDSEFSVTQLLGPPQRTYLATKHEEQKNIIGGFYALLGTVIHKILEEYSREEEGEIAEQRLHILVHGRKVSGQIDLMDMMNSTIFDYKFIGGYHEDMKEDHYRQLQMNGYLAEENKKKFDNVAIVYFMRDWSIMRAMSDPKYPSLPIYIHLKPYVREIGEREFNQRVLEHSAAADGKPRSCTREEKWQNDPTYALMKPGGKRARKLCASREEAEELKKHDEIIEKRETQRVFCEMFCGFRNVCPQYARETLGQIKDQD